MRSDSSSSAVSISTGADKERAELRRGGWTSPECHRSLAYKAKTGLWERKYPRSRWYRYRTLLGENALQGQALELEVEIPASGQDTDARAGTLSHFDVAAEIEQACPAVGFEFNRIAFGDCLGLWA